ncbi:MAG: TSUP family transporter [Chitinophagaceae bacterium]
MTATIVITLLIIGLAAGTLSGLVGVGGGIILVPALVFFFSYTQHQAQGTSLGVLTFPVVILGFLHYYQTSRHGAAPIDLRVIGLLAVSFFAGSYIGSRMAMRIDEEMLKKLFAIVLLFSAVKLLGWDQAVTKWIKNLF